MCIRDSSASDAFQENLVLDCKKSEELTGPVKWRTFRQKQLSKAEKLGKSRAELEEIARTKWVGLVVEIIVEASLPFAESARASLEPERALQRCCGKRRGTTVRARVRTWMQVRWWMLTAYNMPFPRRVYHMTSYLEMRAKEPCSRTVPIAVAAALSFCLLYTSPSPRDRQKSRMPSSA